MFSSRSQAHPGLRFLLKASTSTSHWPLNSCQQLVENTVIHQTQSLSGVPPNRKLYIGNLSWPIHLHSCEANQSEVKWASISLEWSLNQIVVCPRDETIGQLIDSSTHFHNFLSKNAKNSVFSNLQMWGYAVCCWFISLWNIFGFRTSVGKKKEFEVATLGSDRHFTLFSDFYQMINWLIGRWNNNGSFRQEWIHQLLSQLTD